jgi:lipid-binding SYLF domain-containing protein
MITFAKRSVAVLGLALLALTHTTAQAQTDGQQRVVERARLALDAFLDDPDTGDMRVYVQNAYAVLIFPDMLRGGLFVGVEHGIGVLLVRDPLSGNWGQPAFYELFGGSFGLQFGGKVSDVVFTVMNQGAVEQLLSRGIKLGADAGVAAGRLGRAVGAGTTTQLGEDVYMFAKSKGLFGGFWLDGSWLRPKDDWNRAFYGKEVRAAEIVRERPVASGHTEIAALHQALTRF